MQSTFAHIEDLAANAINLAETKGEIFALKATRKASIAASEIVTRLSLLLVSAFLLLMLSFGAAYWIGELLENTAAGFFIVGGFYCLTCLVLFLVRKKLFTEPVQNFIIKKVAGQ